MVKLLRMMPLLVLLVFPMAYADDTDIYLDTSGERANPPYLMLMIDTRPSTGSAFCANLEDCVPKFSENAFAKLCNIYTATPEAICRTFYRDVSNKKTLTDQWPTP